MYELKGTIKVKKDTQQVSDKFRKREFVVSDNDPQYPQVIQFELTQDRCSLLDDYNVGDDVQVTFNVRGREWTSPQGDVRYFVSLNAWRIENLGQAEPTAPAPSAAQPAAPTSDAPPPDTFMPDNSDDDDLPF